MVVEEKYAKELGVGKGNYGMERFQSPFYLNRMVE